MDGIQHRRRTRARPTKEVALEDKSRQLVEQISEMQEEDAVKLAREMLDGGYDPVKLLAHCREAMEIVSREHVPIDLILTDVVVKNSVRKQSRAFWVHGVRSRNQKPGYIAELACLIFFDISPGYREQDTSARS